MLKPFIKPLLTPFLVPLFGFSLSAIATAITQIWTAAPYESTGSEGTFSNVVSISDNVSVGDLMSYTVTASGITSGSMRFKTGSTIAEDMSVDGEYTGTSAVTDSNNISLQISGSQINSGATFAVSVELSIPAKALFDSNGVLLKSSDNIILEAA